MHLRSSQDLTPLNPHPASIINRYFDTLMTLTCQHPVLMGELVKGVGIAGLTLAISPFALPRIGLSAPLGDYASVVTGGLMAGAALATNFFQHSLFGLPVTDFDDAYESSSYQYESATAVLSIEKNQMPILEVRAERHYDAGYAEGYILGESIKINLDKTYFLYPAMCLLLGAPVNTGNIQPYLEPVLHFIPEDYKDEMRGKVDGYNAWLSKNHPMAIHLTFAHYVLLQLLPDLHNYNPFVENKLSSRLPSFPRELGCTTIAMKLGRYTFMTRVLDWPSHDVAGKYFLQVDRVIAGKMRTIDVGMPLLSGALSVLNEQGTFFEMNIAYGEKIKRPAGMPAVFFNRYCAEHASNVEDIDRVLDDQQPLGAYHLTASNGGTTKSFHFYQSASVQGAHVTESLGKRKDEPLIMVVANHGLRYVEGMPTMINHKDSTERKQNIYQMFHHQPSQKSMHDFIDKQHSESLITADDIRQIKELQLQIARVALVSNCESVLCELLVFFDDRLLEASAVTDNLYAQRKPLDEFRYLSHPGLH